MNERIQELLIEAHKQTNGGIYNGHLSEWTEKFAELIVRECFSICQTIGEQAELTNSGEMARKTKATAESCAEMIKLSFGVNEFEQMVEKGTKAWADTPDDWVDELRGGAGKP